MKNMTLLIKSKVTNYNKKVDLEIINIIKEKINLEKLLRKNF
jgi:hypothetical protein